MCGDCGCHGDGHHHIHESSRRDIGAERTVLLMRNLLEDNDEIARALRARFDEAGVLCINLMSSPGSGKTSLLEATIGALPGGLRLAVIEGDLETENDADRIRRHGVPAVQITTGVACHLDAVMVRDAVGALDLAAIDILIIENVGNLVCPADFDLGQHLNVVLLSITEGDDKPEKYPPMFRAADHVLFTKADLAPYFEEFDFDRARSSMLSVGGPRFAHTISSKTKLGVSVWIEWLVGCLNTQRREVATSSQSITPGGAF